MPGKKEQGLSSYPDQVRERDTIKIYSVDEAATKSGAPLDPQMALPFPEAATWSPNGRSAAGPQRSRTLLRLGSSIAPVDSREIPDTVQIHIFYCPDNNKTLDENFKTR